LQYITVPGKIQAFEKNVEWVSKGIRSRTALGGKKSWYVQPGLGGQEMDVFWRRLGMEDGMIKETRSKAVAKMKEMARKKIEGMKNVVEKYDGTQAKREKTQKKISMK
jgi:hypothetical protein